MLKLRKHTLATAITLGAALSTTAPAMAYIGPGAGIGAIGAAVALVLGVLLVLVGFVWFPLKRMMRKRRANSEMAAEGKTDAAS